MNLITDVAGIRVGHADDPRLGSGVTAILFDTPVITSADVRGGGPGTRELELLAPGHTVEHVDAIVLSGGSAFGLDAASGVQAFLREHGRGFRIGPVAVPIVPAAILFDLGAGDAAAFPDADAGYAATLAAEANDGTLEGRVGAGTGATVAKLGGADSGRPGGIGSAAQRLPDGSTLGAIVALNALGDVHARDGRALASSSGMASPPPVGNTTLVVIATDAPLDRAQCHKLSEIGHDALARQVRPTHTMFDGDVVFTLSTADGARMPTEAFFGLGLVVLDVVGEAIERAVDG